MRTFTDNANRTWTVTVNVDAIKRVKGTLGVNLLEAIEGKLLDRLATDPVLLCDILYVLCRQQADAAGVSDEDFGGAMAGDVIEQATTAFLEELAGFFPKGRRDLLTKALGKLAKLEAMALTAASERLDSDALERELQQRIATGVALAETVASASVTSSPESSESIPDLAR
jgi:hypothetical protein